MGHGRRTGGPLSPPLHHVHHQIFTLVQGKVRQLVLAVSGASCTASLARRVGDSVGNLPRVLLELVEVVLDQPLSELATESARRQALIAARAERAVEYEQRIELGDGHQCQELPCARSLMPAGIFSEIEPWYKLLLSSTA